MKQMLLFEEAQAVDVQVSELIAAAKHAAEVIHTMHSDREKGREEGERVARIYGGQITGWVQSLEWFDRLEEAHANLLKALEPFQGGAV